MLKYLIVPHWLFTLLSENKREAEACMDFALMTQLLTPEEMACYRLMNSLEFVGRIQELSSRKAITRLCFCESAVNLFSEALESNDKSADYFLSEFDLREIVNGIAFSNQPADGLLTLLPSVLGQGVFCFTPAFVEGPNPPLVREDIYKTLKEFQTVDEIIQSPLFGL